MSQASPPVPPIPGYFPLTMGQILDRTFRLLRSHFLQFLRIAAVFAAAMLAMYAVIGAALIVSGAFPKHGQTPDPIRVFAVLAPVGLSAWVVLMAVYAIFEAAATHASLQANLGIEVSFCEAYAPAMRKAGRVLWLIVLRYLWIGLPILVLFGTLAGLSFGLFHHRVDTAPGALFLAFPLFVLTYFGALVYGVIMMIRLALALPVCVSEGVSASCALKRSLALTRNAKGRIFVVMLTVYAAGYAAMMLFEAICFAVIGGGALFASSVHMQITDTWAVIAFAVLGLCLFGVLLLLIATLAAGYVIASTVLYHDQRLRVDGLPPLPAGEPA